MLPCTNLIRVISSNTGTKSSGSSLKIFRRLKFLVWFQERIRPTDLQGTLIWAGIIGFCGGICSIAFRIATSVVHKILTGSSEPGLVENFSQMPLLLRPIVPAVGGLLAGAIIQFGTRFRGQVTTTDYMEAVVLGDGKIAARRTLLKCLSSLFTLHPGARSDAKAPSSSCQRWSHLSGEGFKNGPRRDFDCSWAVARLPVSHRL